MVFFTACWFSLPLLPRKRLIKNNAVCSNFPGLIKRVKLDELSFIVQLFNYLLCQRLLMGCRSYVASLAENFRIIAEGFVCFCKERVSDNGKGLFSGGLLRCRSRAARIAVSDFLF